MRREASVRWILGLGTALVSALVLLHAHRPLAAETPPAPSAVPPVSGAEALALVERSPTQAASLATAVVLRDPDDDRAHEALHAAYQAMGRTQHLPARYRAMQQDRPDEPRYRLEHGRALLRAGQREEAIAAFEATLAREPRTREVRRLLGLTLLETGRFERAADELAKLRPLDPGTARYLGIAFVLSGRPHLGVEVLHEVVETGTDPEGALFLAVALRETGQLVEAEAQLRGLVTDPRASVRAQTELARIYLEPASNLYRPDLARYHAEAAARRGSLCYEVLARAYAACGDTEMARITAEVGLADAQASSTARAECEGILALLPAPR